MVLADISIVRWMNKRKQRAQRRRRVAELQADPKVMEGVREGLESERLGKGVRFEDLRRRDG